MQKSHMKTVRCILPKSINKSSANTVDIGIFDIRLEWLIIEHFLNDLVHTLNEKLVDTRLKG